MVVLKTQRQRWGVWRAGYGWLLDQLYRYLGLYWASVYRAPVKTQFPPVPAKLTVRLATPQELAPYAMDSRFQLSASYLEQAFARGEACVVTYVGDQFAAYGWVAYASAPHVDGLWIRFGPGQRYNYKSFTVPAFRGQHIRGSFGVLQALDAQHAVTHTISFIQVQNFASHRAEARSGGVRVGYAGYLRLFGRCFTLRTPGAARYGFAFTSRAE